MSKKEEPNVLKMIRAPFLSSIISPLVAGTLLAISINNSLNLLGFVFVLIMGIGLHIATNVYNDIYDTLQGTDKINVHRNEFSGGSGVLLDRPDLKSTMYLLARMSLLLAFLATLILMFFVVNKTLWIYLWGLYFLAAFFSKYYTAAPVMVAYRGWGEISVWFAFGPMAILIAAIIQNVGFHPTIIAAMPITGISTLSILLLGQMIDLEADKATGKLGVAARLGNKVTAYIYLTVQLILMANVTVLALFFTDGGYPILIGLIPYILFLPKIENLIIEDPNNIDSLKKAAGLNVKLHLTFSLLFSLGIGGISLMGK